MSESLVPIADGVSLHLTDTGSGCPVIFQHGLGGDRNQVVESFPDNPPCRRITIECRGHGLSNYDPQQRYSIAGFTDDILTVADRLGLERFAIGGISMGAAIAMRLAALHPERVSALILIRPAWLTENAPDNMEPFIKAAHFLQLGSGGKEAFQVSPTGHFLAANAPDNLASLLGFFDRDKPEALAVLLEAIALDGPDLTELQLRALDMPVLIAGHGMDHVHPLAFARALAQLIPTAHLAEVTPKAVDKARYLTELKATIAAFLRDYVIVEETTR
jgi:pimeloyl-ACP methyl ester carboxylesterase